jgi:hypothetical protein
LKLKSSMSLITMSQRSFQDSHTALDGIASFFRRSLFLVIHSNTHVIPT